MEWNRIGVFKVGDRVKLMTERHGVSKSNPYWPKYGVEGIIMGLGGKYMVLPIDVDWDNRNSNAYSLDDLKIVDEKWVDELFEEIEL